MKKLFILIMLSIVVLFSSNQDNVVIPSTSIRMRVIASSNSSKDQNDKIKVKSALEEILYNLSNGIDDYNELDKKISYNKENIDSSISKYMRNNNINTSFSSNYGYNYFPEKEFKGITYKSGMYKSYVVTLGNGDGENWWCVLYPPLCLIDENIEDSEYHFLIKDTIMKYN